MNQGVPDSLRLECDEQLPRLRPMARTGSARSRIRHASVASRRERLRTEHTANDVRARLAQVVRQAGDGRRVEKRDDGDVMADLLLEPVDQHGPLDRVAAQLEKIVERRRPARLAARRARGPPGTPPGACAARRRAGPSPAVRRRRGQGAAVHLAAGGAGQGRQRDEDAAGTMYSGKRSFRWRRSGFGGERLAVGDRRRHRRPAGIAPRCPPRRRPAASRTEGWLSSADSTSPSSMR